VKLNQGIKNVEAEGKHDTANESVVYRTHFNSYNFQEIIFCMMLVISHIIVEEFWPTVFYSLYLPRKKSPTLFKELFCRSSLDITDGQTLHSRIF